MNIKTIENFITVPECDLLVSWFRGNINSKGRENISSQFNYKQIDHTSIDDKRVWEVMEKYRWKVAIAASKHYDYDLLYPEYSDLVIWRQGEEMALHADNWDYINNKPFNVDLYFREVSCLVYLNDDFKGGETFFEDGSMITPKKGMLSMFPSDLTHKHGVKRVTEGVRYTFPSWLTSHENIIHQRAGSYFKNSYL